jgi:hypothetical protein
MRLDTGMSQRLDEPAKRSDDSSSLDESVLQGPDSHESIRRVSVDDRVGGLFPFKSREHH